jgi:hypothetical protein
VLLGERKQYAHLLRHRLLEDRRRLLLVLERLLTRAQRTGGNSMQLIARFRPSPAMVVAALALLVALTGTGVAAVALVPRNSVGSDQVINGSLRSVDFKPGEVISGSDAVSRSFAPVNLVAGDRLASAASLSIARPGAYLIWARAQVVSPTVAGGQCTLIAHGVPGGAGATPDAVSTTSVVDQTAGTNAPTLWMTLVHGFATTGGSIELLCGGGAKGPFGVRDIKISAVRLGGGD